MPYVATDNASAPPAFTGSTSFHPFSHFNLFNPHKTICRNGSAAAFKFAAISSAPSSSQCEIGAYLRRSGAIDQRRWVNAPSGVWQAACREKPLPRKCRGNAFKFFVRTGEERL